MKLVRPGHSCRERPSVRLDERTYIAVSDVVKDHDEECFGSDGLDRLAISIEERVSSGHVSNLVDELLDAPIPQPRQSLCIGLGYADHAEETEATSLSGGHPLHECANTSVGSNEHVRIPQKTTRVDWEVEVRLMRRVKEAFDTHGILNP